MTQQEIIEHIKKELTQNGVPGGEVENAFATLTPKEIEDKYWEYINFARVCSVCGKWMHDGFCIESGMAYYCTQECMEKDGMTWEHYLELYNDGDGDTYWTEWY